MKEVVLLDFLLSDSLLKRSDAVLLKEPVSFQAWTKGERWRSLSKQMDGLQIAGLYPADPTILVFLKIRIWISFSETICEYISIRTFPCQHASVYLSLCLLAFAWLVACSCLLTRQ